MLGGRGPGVAPPRTLQVACMNVRGCSSSEEKRLEIGEMFDRRKLDVCALSETKMLGVGERMFGRVKGRVSGVSRGRAREGVAILVKDWLLEWVREWREVSSRIMWVKIKVGCDTFVFVSVYAPGNERSEAERVEFWTELNDCVSGFRASEKLIVLGDMNARVGNEVMEGVVGSFGVPGRNENGASLVRMCRENELCIANTWFKKKDISKYTWVRVIDGEVRERAMLDYVIVRREAIGSVLDVHVYRGEASGLSDHFLVNAVVKVDMRWRRRETRGENVRYELKVSALDDENKRSEYQHKVSNQFANVRELDQRGVEVEWSDFKNAVCKSAEEVCGWRRVGGKKRNGSEWWNEEVKRAVEYKKRLFEEWLQGKDRVKYERYKEQRREVKVIIRRAKRDADWRWGRRLEENYDRNNRMFWKEVKSVRKKGDNSSCTIKDANGIMVSDSTRVKSRWVEHFKVLLNVRDDSEAEVANGGNDRRVNNLEVENEAEVSKVEVEGAMRGMKAGKSPGMDGCRVECLKYGGETVVMWLVRLFNVCLREGVVPADWTNACIVPLYKGKGDKYECGNWRGISLLSVVGKLYGKVLINRIKHGTEECIGEEQCGFRCGRGCVDQIATVRHICEKYLRKGKDVFWAFMDLEKAYDRVDRNGMWEVLRQYGVSGKLLQAVKSLYVNSRACVRVGSEVSESFEVHTGLRQGCVMSPWLFNIYMDGVVKEVSERVQGSGLGLIGEDGLRYEVSQLLFADDTALVADSVEELERLVHEFDRVCKKRKLKVNVGKSKVMKSTRDANAGALQISLNGEVLEEVRKFSYLGSCVESSNGCVEEVAARVEKGYQTWGALKGVTKCRSLGMSAKRKLYESVVIPAVTYGAETWAMRMEERRSLNVLEMRCLRSMAGLTRRDRVRNEEVRRRTGVLKPLDQRVDEKLLRWFGHVERMDEERLLKRVSLSSVEGRNRRGRPKMEWMDGVKKALSSRNLTIEQAKVVVNDRSEWRRIVNGVD